MLVGMGLAIWQPVELPVLLGWGEWLTAHPGMLLLLVFVMTLLFSLGLPGSAFIWLVAPFQPLVVSTGLLVTGSVAGAAGAYHLARALGSDLPVGPRGERIRIFLASHGNMATQCALRLLPGFPHAAINFGAGVLKLPRLPFLLAALLGLTVKWAVYTSAIHSGLGALERGEVIALTEVLPLVLLAVMLLIGVWLRSRLERHGK